MTTEEMELFMEKQQIESGDYGMLSKQKEKCTVS
jgi:hypothetical protein